MIRSVEVKLYPTGAQEVTLNNWMDRCAWVYNCALEHRIKSYRRRGKSVTFNTQSAMLTGWRRRMTALSEVPVIFARDALRRVDRGMQAFFRRCKAGGEKPGFPRFRSRFRYNSIESLSTGSYVRPGNYLSIPKLGLVKFRGGNQSIPGTQRLLRVIRRASGWFAQVLVDDAKPAPEPKPILTSIGIDVGLTHFATLSDGTKIDNPRWARTSYRRLRSAQRRVSRRIKGSRNRRKTVLRLRKIHERIAAQRKDFAHQHSTALVRKYDLIGFENLNIRGLARTRMARSVLDAAWGMFTNFLTYKAAWAGRQAVGVNPRGTSQECPRCGAVKPKQLSEREHRCDCGCVMDRDHAAAQVILARALGVAGASPVED